MKVPPPLTIAEDHAAFGRLNALCQSITPGFKGTFSPDRASDAQNALTGTAQDLAIIRRLYQHIQTTHPEASQGYWLIRTWDLLTWQPVYLSLMGVYGLQAVPDLTGLRQQYQQGLIMGFALPAPAFFQGERDALIQQAADQLQPLLAHYRTLLDEWRRCRRGMADQLLADMVLANLAKLQLLKPAQSAPRISTHPVTWDAAKIQQQAKIWLKALALPLSNSASLRTDESGCLHFTRRSCCLVYQTQHGELCADCPRLKRHRLRTTRSEERKGLNTCLN